MNVYIIDQFRHDSHFSMIPLQGFKTRLVRYANINDAKNGIFEGMSEMEDGFPYQTEEGLGITFLLGDNPQRKSVDTSDYIYNGCVIYYKNLIDSQDYLGILITDIQSGEYPLVEGLNTLLIKGLKLSISRIGTSFLESNGVITFNTPLREGTRLYSLWRILNTSQEPSGLQSEIKIINTY